MTRTFTSLLLAAALTLATAASPTPARADGGATAAWIIGGFIVGGLLIAATSRAWARPAWYGPPCYTTRVRYHGRWRYARVCQ
jgi:hypothetical protein